MRLDELKWKPGTYWAFANIGGADFARSVREVGCKVNSRPVGKDVYYIKIPGREAITCDAMEAQCLLLELTSASNHETT